MDIRDNLFIVTGGASGLGAATAKLLASLGGKVVAVDLNQPSGDSAAVEPGAIQFEQADVISEAQTQAAITAAIAGFGPLRGMVHCAGVLGASRVVGKTGPHDLALFSRIVQINLIGTFNVARLAAAAMVGNPPLEDGERGIIINTASVAAFEGQIGQAAYAASKGGVASMTLPMARELARFGVRVVAIAPGVFDTAMMAGASDETQQSLTAQIPFPARTGRPEEFAKLAQHIIENRMLNGAVLRIDGALRMQAK